MGGLYKIGYRVSQARPWTEVNVYLPMAGSEITDPIGRDMARTNEFTSWAPYNGVLTDPSRCSPKGRLLRRSVLGGGVVATCFGVPTRVSKASDFLIGYAMGAFNYSDLALLMAQMFGTRNNRSGTLAFLAGALHARGELTWQAVEAMVVDIYDDFGDPDGKHRKLWPNPALPANHVAQPIDYDSYFVCPGFLTMERK
ncbi:MAG: hypothetical protein ACE5F1_11875 [Planctomycetota bacterium]